MLHSMTYFQIVPALISDNKILFSGEMGAKQVR